MKLLMESWRKYLAEDKLDEGMMQTLAITLSMLLNNPSMEAETYPSLKPKLIQLQQKALSPEKFEGNFDPKDKDLILAILKLRQNNPKALSNPEVLTQLDKNLEWPEKFTKK